LILQSTDILQALCLLCLRVSPEERAGFYAGVQIDMYCRLTNEWYMSKNCVQFGIGSTVSAEKGMGPVFSS